MGSVGEATWLLLRSRAKEGKRWESTVLGLLFLAWRLNISLLGCALNVAERRQDCGLKLAYKENSKIK